MANISIKNAPIKSNLTGEEKIPVSDGTDQPITITVNLIIDKFSNINNIEESYLPLSGGTLTSSDVPLTINRTGNVNSGIRFQKDGIEYGSIGFYDGLGLSYYDANSIGWYKIWNENNDGTGSGLDADMLDGKHATNFVVTGDYPTSSTNNFSLQSGLYKSRMADNGLPSIGLGNGIIHCEWDGNAAQQLFLRYDTDGLYYRRKITNQWKDWKTVAFTDSNVASADKLSTPRKLWGQSFDGSGDVSGSLYMPNESFISFKRSTGENDIILTYNNKDVLSLGYGSGGAGRPTYIYGGEVYIHTGSSRINAMTLSSSGNVGIGTNSPAYKLDVNGMGCFRDTSFQQKMVTLGSGIGIHSRKDSSTEGSAQGVSAFGYSGTSLGSMSGAMIIGDTLEYFYYGKGYSNSPLNIYPSGNISVGGLSDTNTLSVLGTLSVSGATTINSSLSVHDKITSGDYCDWYGVSWSENSSNPTCTRIGNMAMHRSLPILSAMKRYIILNNISAEYSRGLILPYSENLNVLKYGNVDNNLANAANTWTGGHTMVKIPEFWYIDDYEPSTKTHNLKISQTAKAGWCHHKEAYVGAYEGWVNDNNNVYASRAGQIPTVSVTREQLRTKARANGYEGESKWNIYTYEEHRAICHLFLVEYATRNSQLAVNPELTAEGFKQGGLGSGCTTGTMDGAYSFIPTGTTDSLGDGSGQVAYTASNGTTYYANRYRGIENPFGHIWKHCDDIINIYDANTTYKTVYKCDKPEHFATNKNAKYKPLCSFPGNLQGYTKEIKATINCDFFPMAIEGNNTTYWCDYVWNSTDTSEHCLLIGGHSDDGDLAGLFNFHLSSGVSASFVHLGSRLTYLPWAE